MPDEFSHEKPANPVDGDGVVHLLRLGAEGQSGIQQERRLLKVQDLYVKTAACSHEQAALYASVVGSIRHGIESKGLVSVEKGGDLTVIAGGSLDYGLDSDNPLADTCDNCQAPQVDVLLWAGFEPPPGSAGKPQPKGVLRVDMVDPASNKEVWVGTVEQKLDPQKPNESLQKVGAAIEKLFSEFPPKAK